MITIDVQEIMSGAEVEKLSRFFAYYKQHLYKSVRDQLNKEPQTVYKRFICDHPEGQNRSRTFLGAFQAALAGRADVLLEDQRRIGYRRAVEGYELEDVFAYKTAFNEVLWQVIDQHNATRQSEAETITSSDIRVIQNLINYSNFLLSDSFLRTRDEIIQHQRNQLQELHLFAVEAISIFGNEGLQDCAAKSLAKIFGLDGSYMMIYNRDGLMEKQHDSKSYAGSLENDLVLRVMKEDKAFAFDDKGDIVSFNENMKQEVFQAIGIPVHTTDLDQKGLFVIYDHGRPFSFQKFDKNLLYQVAYFTGAILSNSVMFSELASKKEELRDLTARLIFVQEEEKKKLGADIHDTITQSLTAIGYKALLCQALINKDSHRLDMELGRLIDDINGALKKSRSIISELRPKILDDLGIVATVKQAIANFREDSGLVVHFRCPDSLEVDSEVGIALYRIVQESLRNVYKHAGASEVDVSLDFDGEGRLILEIQDDGKGFSSALKQSDHQSGLGLLTMRERAEDLGGTFMLQSERSKGCRIKVTVPHQLPAGIE